jgi:hypothetical protein
MTRFPHAAVREGDHLPGPERLDPLDPLDPLSPCQGEVVQDVSEFGGDRSFASRSRER